MSRTRTLLTVLIPAAIAGGMFASPPSRADDDDDAAAIAAEAKQQIKLARKQAKEQLKAAREQIENAPMPEKLRDKLIEKLDRIAEKIDEKLKDAQSADFGDLDQLDEQMEAMGEAIAAEMEQMSEDWEQWGEDFQKGFKDSWGNGNGNVVVVPAPPAPPDPPDFDPDDYPAPPAPPTPPTPPTPPSWSDSTSATASASAGVPAGIDIDLGDLDISIDVGDLDLAADQVAALGDIFDAQQDVIEPAAEALEDLAGDLRTMLADPDATEAEVGKLVDKLSAQEAVIRKAQIVAWVKSRNLLDADQRDKVEHAKVKRAKRAKHH